MTNTGKFSDRDTAIALIAADVEVVKGTTREIKDQLTGFIEKCDEKFTNFNSRLVREETSGADVKEDIVIAHKRVDKLSDMISHSILNHEKSCPSREATLQRLAKPSRPPKDTPVSIKKPDFFSVHEIVPRWLLWSAAAIGISVALFVLVYYRAKGFLFP